MAEGCSCTRDTRLRHVGVAVPALGGWVGLPCPRRGSRVAPAQGLGTPHPSALPLRGRGRGHAVAAVASRHASGPLHTQAPLLPRATRSRRPCRAPGIHARAGYPGQRAEPAQPGMPRTRAAGASPASSGRPHPCASWLGPPEPRRVRPPGRDRAAGGVLPHVEAGAGSRAQAAGPGVAHAVARLALRRRAPVRHSAPSTGLSGPPRPHASGVAFAPPRAAPRTRRGRGPPRRARAAAHTPVPWPGGRARAAGAAPCAGQGHVGSRAGRCDARHRTAAPGRVPRRRLWPPRLGRRDAMAAAARRTRERLRFQKKPNRPYMPRWLLGWPRKAVC